MDLIILVGTLIVVTLVVIYKIRSSINANNEACCSFEDCDNDEVAYADIALIKREESLRMDMEEDLLLESVKDLPDDGLDKIINILENDSDCNTQFAEELYNAAINEKEFRKDA